MGGERGNSGNAIGTAGAIAPPQKEESILVGKEGIKAS